MKHFFTLLFAFMAFSAFASETDTIYDNCPGFIIPTPVSFCDTFTNTGATESIISNFPPEQLPSCWNTAARDVWLSFTTDTIVDYVITVTGINDGTNDALNNLQVAVYRGTCAFGDLAELACVQAPLNTALASLELLALDPNETYFIRINNYNQPADAGTFEFCIQEYIPAQNICDVNTQTITTCTGTLYDCGGPDADYGNNQNFTVTVQPTGFNQCLIINVASWDIPNVDDLFIYDGTTTTAPLIGNLFGTGFGAEFQASSGAFTLQFISNVSVVGDGFELSWTCSPNECTLPSPLVVTPNVPLQEIEDAFVTPQTQIFNMTLNCPTGAYGTFTATNSQFGMDEGIILSSGLAVDAAGPNILANFASTILAPNGAADPGDADLFNFPGNTSVIRDACILEFDVYVATDELVFDYAFGSEEYEEFVNSSFNDIFAFFISGPGITGPFSDNAVNIAVLENTTPPIPVSINTVNQNAPFNPVTNQQVYFNNNAGVTTTYDGYTAVLQAKREGLIPCNIYHLKLAIADRGDESYDSGVFLANLKAGTPELAINFNVVSDDNILVEDCSFGNSIDVTLTNPLDEDVVYYLDVAGTAINGVDFTPVPDSVVFPPGTTTVNIPIDPITDGVTEGPEIFKIRLFEDYGCGITVFDSVEVTIIDQIEVNVTQDTFFACAGSSVTLGVEGAANFIWSPTADFVNPVSPTPTLNPTGSGWFYVSGFIGANCSDTDSAYVQIIDPVINITTPNTVICQGTDIQVFAATNTGGFGITWTPAAAVVSSGPGTATLMPNVTTTFTATLAAGNCTVTDNIVITVDPLTIPQLINNPTICQGSSIPLANAVGPTTTTYQWTPATGLSNATIANPVAGPSDTTTYTVVATSVNGACSNTQTVTVNVLPADVEILGPDVILLCVEENPDPITLTADVSTGGPGLTWTSSDGSITSNALSITVDPASSTTYTATLAIGLCQVDDEVTIQLDSLPDLTIITNVIGQGAFPGADTVEICAGDFVFFQNPPYSGYPGIEHEWTANGQPFNPAQTNPNLAPQQVFTSTLFTRETVNGQCSQTEEVLVFINIPPSVFLAASDTSICLGESVTLEGVGSNSFVFGPNDGSLSNITATSATATPTQTTTYTALTGLSGCDVIVTRTVSVSGEISFNIAADATICEGQSVDLGDPSNDPTYTYTWTSSDPSLTGANTGNPTATPSSTSTYDVIITNTACEAEGSVTLTVIPSIDATVSDDAVICEGQTLTLNVSTNVGSITWSASDGSSFANPNASSQTVTPAGDVTYTVSIEAPNDCGTVQLPISVDVGGNFELSADPAVTTMMIGESVDIDVTANFSGTPDPVSYVWTPAAGLDNPNAEDVTASPSENTTYVVTGTTAAGCEDTVQVVINLLFPEDARLPNVFTPNGDGTNDRFAPIFGQGTEILDFQVFSRWGELVHDNPGTGWDGTYNGEPMPADVYVYVVKIRYATGLEQSLKGDFTLLR